VLNQNSSVYDVQVNGWVIQFKTRLQGLVRDQWYDLASKLNNVVLNEGKDLIPWRTTSKKNTVESVYEHLTKDDNGPDFKRVWKTKLPEKIKTLMWLVEQKSILTKNNMLKRWQRVYMLGLAAVRWAIEAVE
jgi:hypothetical protein